jgi:hypothetical protein
MLIAYFDDSGTHDGAPVVLMGGLIGTEDEWKSFEPEWRARLQEPLPGKGALKRFHMTDCEAGTGEFTGWNRAERDAVIKEFRDIILKHDLGGYACAVPRKEWDDLIKWPLRAIVGDAERFCITNCVVQSIRDAESHKEGANLGLVFDSRPTPGRNKMNGFIVEIFQIDQLLHSEKVAIDGPSFVSSERVLPLQAADMVAWEFYQHAQNWLRDGERAAARPHFQRMVEQGGFRPKIASPAVIAKIAEQQIPAKYIEDLASLMDSWYQAQS